MIATQEKQAEMIDVSFGTFTSVSEVLTDEFAKASRNVELFLSESCNTNFATYMLKAAIHSQLNTLEYLWLDSCKNNLITKTDRCAQELTNLRARYNKACENYHRGGCK